MYCKEHFRPGPDPDFPWFSEHERFVFPRPAESNGDIVALGGNLSPGMLLSAYEQGIFPWFNPEDPVIWQSPDPRFVIFPEKLHISASMRKLLRRGEFEIAFDRDFPAVIRGCAEIYREGQGGTWITGDVIAAYTELHRLGWAHSAESYADGELAGGCYGIRLGSVFFGESMFARRSNASKAAFLTLARALFADGLALIDCQVPTAHLAGLGAETMGRRGFLILLERLLANSRGVEGPDRADRRGNWAERYGQQRPFDNSYNEGVS
ncbi:MAG: leucyl/phenylalanyl-tRNA--protein transferase [Treponema sp.]|jgi:leucyl/phenylalanyl-tRNA--protein transferase|nr:leucyl/phenylalanyl-tRNA--protein transferase [Treponema sp.]